MEYEIHPFAADFFPPLSESEVKDLAEDITTNGQRMSIWMVRGKIIDGRNRIAACKLANVQPKIKDASGELPDDAAVARFIISMNINRRHLTASQRAIAALGLVEIAAGKKSKATAEEKAAIKKTQTPEEQKAAETEEKVKRTEVVKEAAEQANVSPAYVYQAEELKEKAPEKFEEVKKGEKTISEARKEMKDEETKNTVTESKGKKNKTEDDELSEEKAEKKALKIVDKCLAELEKIGYTLSSTKIEKI